jgi:hypothetical protein
MARCKKLIHYFPDKVRCVLEEGHLGECAYLWPGTTRCFYQFTGDGDPDKPSRCRLRIDHEGRHEPDY